MTVQTTHVYYCLITLPTFGTVDFVMLESPTYTEIGSSDSLFEKPQLSKVRTLTVVPFVSVLNFY